MSYNEWLDMDVLEDYLDGKLDSKTMHKVEKISLEDPFVAEALAGLSASKRRTQSLSLLQKQLQERIAQKPVEEKRWRITSHRLSIAAAAAVLFITVSILFWMRTTNNQQFANKQPKKVEVAIAPQVAGNKISADSLGSAVSTLKADKIITEKVRKSVGRNNNAAQSSENIVSSEVSSAVAAPIVASAKVDNDKSVIALNESKRAAADTSMHILAYANSRRKAEEQSAPTKLKSKVDGITVNNERFFSGRVYSQDGVPLPGASVRVSGREISTKTDGNGDFKFTADSVGSLPRLTIGYSGFATREVPAKASQPISVVLDHKASASSLSEVVVAPAAKVTIKGKIVDAKTGKPLSNALVRLTTEKNAAVGTNAQGEFSLETSDVNAINQQIVALSIGYVFKEVSVSIKTSNSINLEPRPIPKDLKLSIGSKAATPVGGWEKWATYIKANNKLVKGDPIGNVIILSFDVQDDGNPTAIKVDYGLGNAENAEAIRLITVGPKWIREAGAKRRMQVDVKF